MQIQHSDKMTVSLPSDREIALTRAFDAPRHLVYEAYTKPEYLQRWLGVFQGWTFPVCEIDLRPGGTYRWVWRGPNGEEMGVRGRYHEVVAPERIVASERFDDPWYEGEALNTTTFVESDGRTVVTLAILADTQEIRDAMLQSGMNEGVAASFDNLEEVLASVAATA